MIEPSTTAHDFPSMHVRPSGGHAGLAALRRGLAIDLVLATLSLAVTALVPLPRALGLSMKVGDEGVPDHRELKPLPPRWVMAALLRMDMDPILAIRLRRKNRCSLREDGKVDDK